MLMKHLLLPVQLQVKIISLKVLVYLLSCNCCKKVILGLNLLTNFVLDGTVTKVISGNINVVKHARNNNHMSIFAAATIIVL